MLNLFYGLEGCRQHAGTALLLYIGESGKQVDIFIAAISYDLQKSKSRVGNYNRDCPSRPKESLPKWQKFVG